ncbi:clavaminate synthase-like protein At3g21360 [Macadamia integrifolia]|uniref:clavaminate synthase-like protein At3g21360 n=1 Tax=Macadamia integrifolia TaxID=60698 RepID=UPI001C5026F7|nr:clavaminate synthase-like protein At3g21360 [Macadamia integrifolia]
MEMEFVEGKVEGEKVFGGMVFPKTLNPPKGGGNEMMSCGVDELVEMVKEKSEWLSELLQTHSAVLFRGFGISTKEEFGRVVEAFGWEEMEYMGAISRLKVADRVHTANEAPLDQPINFHHEMALIKKFTSKLFFFCYQPSPEGGETAIVPSYTIVEKMEEKVPEFMAKLSELGFTFRLHLPRDFDPTTIVSRTWKWFLNTDDEVEAEKRAMEMLPCNSIIFNKDGSAEIVYGPMSPIKEFGGRKVWFFSILGCSSKEKERCISFGDGTPFPAEAFHAYEQVVNENCVDLKWQKGDILLVDNLSVQHARRPGKPPRSIFLSICK